MKGFNVELLDFDNAEKLLIIDIIEISDELEMKINQYITEIWEGNTNGDINSVKVEILKYLDEVKGDIKIGAIAEFFIHLYLKENGYEQYCLFQNLEEDKSFKKGFDGLYAINNENWLIESKSTERSEIKHHSKISEAYKDLKNKVEGSVSNNPWKNAYNHANSRDLTVPEDIIKKIRSLSKEFVAKKYHTIGEFNIIPCSTKFLKQDENVEKKEETKKEVKDKIKGFEFNSIKAICINNKVAELFIEYLRKYNE